jgi:hypothetical protein
MHFLDVKKKGSSGRRTQGSQRDRERERGVDKDRQAWLQEQTVAKNSYPPHDAKALNRVHITRAGSLADARTRGRLGSHGGAHKKKSTNEDRAKVFRKSNNVQQNATTPTTTSNHRSPEVYTTASKNYRNGNGIFRECWWQAQLPLVVNEEEEEEEEEGFVYVHAWPRIKN